MKYLGFLFLILLSCTTHEYDIIIRNGTIYDGSGSAPTQGDVAISGDTIAAMGDLGNATAIKEIDATGKAITPGFINVLSWAVSSLAKDGRSMSDIKQGVTLEVFGEGISMGPLRENTRAELEEMFEYTGKKVDWTTLGEYLQYMQEQGVSTNIASFVGATTLRINTIGYDDRPATEAELAEMQEMVHEAMQEGAMGVGSSLIYAPAFYSNTAELIALCDVAAEYDGMYISHIRNEGNQLLESINELLQIASETGIRAEIYHLKMAGQSNWDKYDAVVAKIDSARNAGLVITTDMYTYTAGATGLDASMPPWVQAGGYDEWARRLQDPAIRQKVYEDMITPTDAWENLLLSAGTAENVLLVGFETDSLKYLTGKTLKEVSEMRGTNPQITAMDLVIQDGSRVETVYFLMSEENVRKQVQLPWMSFCSDSPSLAAEGSFLNSSTHPRAYGSFARLLGKYVRDENLISLEEAVYRLSGLPAENLRIQKRGRLAKGNYADVLVFDPENIQDNATFDNPHQYSSGMDHVFVNGTHVLDNGEHTGAMPGRFVRGPGYGKLNTTASIQ